MLRCTTSSKLSPCSCSVMGFHKLHVLSFFVAQLPLLCLIYSSNTVASKNQNCQISNIDKMMPSCLMFASSLKRSNVTKAEPPTCLCTMPFCNSIVDASCSFPVNLVQRLMLSVRICIRPVALPSLTGQFLFPWFSPPAHSFAWALHVWHQFLFRKDIYVVRRRCLHVVATIWYLELQL